MSRIFKRGWDLASAAGGLLVLSPVLVLIALLVWLEDYHSPWFCCIRVGRDGAPFRMVKFRSMHPDAWRSGVNSTASDDLRITRVGHILRRAKLDELPQLWNVLKGDMSLVGPRPQVAADAALYTARERGLLAVRPGMTDLASIVFADEGQILEGASDPDLLYNQLIRPWKSRLALCSVERGGLGAYLLILGLTCVGLLSRSAALAGVDRMLEAWNVDPLLRSMARRDRPLLPYPPPGARHVVDRYPKAKSQSGTA